MSLFSRFKKAPPAPAATKQPETTPSPPPRTAPDPAVLAAREDEALRAAVASGDSGAVATLVLEGTSTRIRQQAAEAVEDPEQIRKLIRSVRGGNDKSVYKILTRKRDALLAQEREAGQRQAEILAVSAEIERHSRRPYDALFTPTLEQLENRWNLVATDATAATVAATQQAIDRSREAIAQHLRQIAAQASRELAAANAAAAAQARREQQEKQAAAAAAEQAQSIEEERKARKEKLESETQALHQIGGLLRKARGALASGSSKTAAGLRRAIEEKLPHAPPLPGNLASQLKQLDEKLQELKDWKRFSVAPKRVDLIERMEALIGASMHPTAIAGHIKDLQEQWRTLSKGAAADDVEADWQRFHEASQKAFQPCREFYDAQDKIKEENLRQRSQVFDRLLAFEGRQNWDEPDWRTAITAVREARQLWRQHSPVDPEKAEALQRKFNELTSGIQSRIDAEYARNVQTKRSLIERARGLVEAPDNRAAIDEVKRLQEQWKSVGPVPRDEDGKLWEQFREQCDALFQKRQKEFDSRNAAFEANKSQASGLCEELEKIAGQSEQELIENARKLPDLRLAFDSIELPKANARQLQDRFERAFERCRKSVARQHARDAERGWTDLFDAANVVRTYRLAVAQNADATQIDALKQAAEQQVVALAQAPKAAVAALKNALGQAGNTDLAANASALRMLCIRAEILTESQSPAEDQPVRREYQLKRLTQGMGQGRAAQTDTIEALTIEWLRADPVDEAVYLPLAERFKECRKRAVPS